MTPNETAELEQLLSEVEKDEDGNLIILSKFGFRIVELGGRKYVAASSFDELVEAVAKRGDENVEQARQRLTASYTVGPWCQVAGPVYNCYPQQGCFACTKVYIGGGAWNCICG